MPILKIEKLTKKYGKTYALNGLDMEVKKGDIYGFVGPNGAGKTTTLRIISGLLKSDGGDLTSLWQTIVYGLGSGLGWWLAIVMMAAIREKTTYSHIPAALKGPGIAFIITGLMGIAFMIFSGIQF